MTTATAAEVQAEAIATIRKYRPACRGCGITFARTDEHRADCTVEPSPLMCADCDEIRLPSERGALWQYRPETRTYHCPTHHQKGTAA